MNTKGITYPALLAVTVAAAVAAGLVLNHFYPLSFDGVIPLAAGDRRMSSSVSESTAPRKTQRAADSDSPVPAGAKRIPAQVYSQNKPTDTWADVFYGDEKLALLITAPGCPYRAKYQRDFEWTLSRPEFSAAYRQKIIVTPQSFAVSARSPYNAQNYLLKNCMGRLCIIEPRKRWIAAVNSQNFSEAASLLSRFKDE